MLAKDQNKKNDPKIMTDSPVLDLNNSAIKSLIKKGKVNGFVTLDELNAALPPGEYTSEQIEDIHSAINEMGFNIVDQQEETTTEDNEDRTAGNLSDEEGARSDDPRHRYRPEHRWSTGGVDRGVLLLADADRAEDPLARGFRDRSSDGGLLRRLLGLAEEETNRKEQSYKGRAHDGIHRGRDRGRDRKFNQLKGPESLRTPTQFHLALARISETPQVSGDVRDALLRQSHLGGAEHERTVEQLLFLDPGAGDGLNQAAHGLDHERITGGQYHAGDDHAVVEHHARAFEAVRDVIGRLGDVQDQRLERLLLGIGRQVRAEVDTLAIELMTGLADGRGGLTVGDTPLERGDGFNRSERLRSRHLGREIGAEELGGRGVAAAGLDDRVDIERLPEAALTIADPPLGEIRLGELLVQREFDHGAGGLGAARKGQRGEVALELGLDLRGALRQHDD
mgnify:CR=1 FL=1